MTDDAVNVSSTSVQGASKTIGKKTTKCESKG